MSVTRLDPGKTQSLPLNFLYSNVESSKWALPEFQRPKVWKWKQERELLISLSLDVPIGSFLLWEYKVPKNKGDTHYDTKPFKFDYEAFNALKKPYNGIDALVLDGQQRLGFLAYIQSQINNKKVSEKDRYVAQFEMVEKKPRIDFFKFNESKHFDRATNNLKHPERNAWVDELADGGNNKVIPALHSDYHQIATTFRTNITTKNVSVYTLPITVKRNEALFVFQRVNSSGLKLIEEDYIEATLGYIHPDLAKQIRAFTKEGGPLDNNIPNLSKKLNRKVFLKCILDEIYKTPILKNARRDGLDLFHPRIVTRHAKKATKTTKAVEEKSDSLTKTKIRNAYSSVKRSFEELEKIFNENWNIHDSKYLLTNEIVFASAYIRHVKPKASDPFDGKQRGKLSKWMFLSMINKPTTGGSTLPMTEAACKVMRKPNPWTNLPNALKKNNIPLKPTLRVDHFGSHDRDEADSILKENSTIFALILCHNNLNKCTDVVDKTSLSGSNLNLDHFYAKKQMKKTKTKGHFDFLWDHAANKIWLNSGTNKWKNAKWPTEIKKGEIHTGSGHNTKKFDQTVKDNLTHQALPDKSVKVEKKHLFSGGKVVPKYIKFLEFRVKNLVKQLNKTLDHMDKNGF